MIPITPVTVSKDFIMMELLNVKPAIFLVKNVRDLQFHLVTCVIQQLIVIFQMDNVNARMDILMTKLKYVNLVTAIV